MAKLTEDELAMESISQILRLPAQMIHSTRTGAEEMGVGLLGTCRFHARCLVINVSGNIDNVSKVTA